MRPELTPSRRRALRARAHSLNPTVIIGEARLTPAVLAELNRAVDAHELIKIKVAGLPRGERDAMLQEICDALGAAPVQHIGRMLVVFRENPDAAGDGPAAESRAESTPQRRRRPPAGRPRLKGARSRGV